MDTKKTDSSSSNCKHDCKDLLEKVLLALDGELSTEDEKLFLAELQKCDHCLSKYEIEQTFKKFLCDKIKQVPVNPDMVSNIKNTVSRAIQE